MLLPVVLTLSANMGFEPFHLTVEVRNPARGYVCVAVEDADMKMEDDYLPIDVTKSCWRAEEQYLKTNRTYRLIPYGNYYVRLTVDGKEITREPLHIKCSEYGNESNQSRCPDNNSDFEDPTLDIRGR